MKNIGKKTHIKSDTVRKTDLDYYPICTHIYWTEEKNIFGKLIKSGWYRRRSLGPNGYWLDSIPDNCVATGNNIRYKPKVSISIESLTLEKYFNTPREAKEFYVKLLEDLTKYKYVEF